MNDKMNITNFQLFFLLIHMQVGVGVLSLPYDIFVKAKNNGWLSVIITGLIIQTILLLFHLLMSRFPEDNIFDISKKLFGKFFGNICIFLFYLCYVFIGILILVKFAYLLHAWMMPHTPKWVLLGLISFTAVFIVKENIKILARFATIASVVFIGFFVLIIYAIRHANFSNVLPIASEGVLPIIEGLPPSIFAFQGFELFIVVYPFMQSSPKNILKTVTIANAFVTFFYLFLVLVSIMFFSEAELKLIPEPVLYLIKSFSFRIIERPDLLFTSMWIVLVATTYSGTIYASSLALTTFRKTRTLTIYASLTAFICFVGALTFTKKQIITFASYIQNYFIVPFLWGIPVLLLLVSLLFQKKGEVKSTDEA